MLLQSTLVGAFRRKSEVGGERDEALSAWQCLLCSTVNKVDANDSPPYCKTCQRSRNPQWLRLEDSGLQIMLGSRVFHTSVGGSKSVSIVVTINYVQKVVTLLRAKAKRNEATQQGDISFHKIVLNELQMQQQLEPLNAEQEEDCVIDNYGVCGECRGVFHVAQGDPQSQYANEDRVSEIEKELQQLREQKQRHAMEKAYETALKCTEQLKQKTKELHVAKRELEFLSPVFCPYCGWLSAPPFQ